MRGDGRPRADRERGCLEARFSGAALARDTVEATEQDRSLELASQLEANGTLTAVGDAIALDLIREGGNRTGQVIVGLFCFFNPDLVVIGGGVTGLGTPCSSRCAPSATASGCLSPRATCPRAGGVGA